MNKIIFLMIAGVKIMDKLIISMIFERSSSSIWNKTTTSFPYKINSIYIQYMQKK